MEALEHQWFKTAEFKKKDKVNTISRELAKELITNMTNYKSNNIIAYLVYHLTKTEECMEASKLFNKIDLNSDGKIEKHELIQGFQKYFKILCFIMFIIKIIFFIIKKKNRKKNGNWVDFLLLGNAGRRSQREG